MTVEEPELCPRFTARVISGVKVGESPWWLRKRLETIGVRPISNIVDVTNYVMFECGQPLHAYDLDRLAEHRLVVRRARAGEKLTAINNKVYELTPDMLVDRRCRAAGRPGGRHGRARDRDRPAARRNVLIEAAQFDAMSVRRTSRALGLFSPSSFRFERPLDPEGTEWASRRCAELILEVAGGTLHPGVIDVGRQPPERPPITLRLGQIERILGIAIDRATAARILEALGPGAVGARTGSSLTFRPPSWRSDLEREIDLIEEVARIHGYEHIPEDRAVPLTSAPRGHRERVEAAVRDYLTGCRLRRSRDLQPGRRTSERPARPGSGRCRRCGSTTPAVGARRALRQSLVPSLLAVRLHNESHGQFDAELFEIANVYLPASRTRLCPTSRRG